MKNKYLNKTKVAIGTLFAGLFLCTALSSNAQCAANYSYTIGSNGTVNFQSTSIGTSTATSYYWSFGASGWATGSTASYVFLTNGMKSVCLHIVDTLITAGCSSTKCDSVLITNVSTVTPCNPSVAFYLSKDSTQTLAWNALPSYPTNITNASWTWGDGSTSNGLYPSHTYSAAGTYSICVTVSVSCGTVTATYCHSSAIYRSSQSSSMLTVNVKQSSSSTTGIKTLEMQNELVNIYPNPNNGLFTIALNESIKDSKVASIAIYNMVGEKVFEKNDLSSTDKTINVSELPNGTYFVRLVSGTGYANKKISIQK